MPSVEKGHPTFPFCVMDLEGFTRCRGCGGSFVVQEICIVGFDENYQQDIFHTRVTLCNKLYKSVMSCKECRGSAKYVISNLTGLPLQHPYDHLCSMSNRAARAIALQFIERYGSVWAKGKRLEQDYLGPDIRVRELEDLGCPKATQSHHCYYHQPLATPGARTHCALFDVNSYIKWIFSSPPTRSVLHDPPMLFVTAEE